MRAPGVLGARGAAVRGLTLRFAGAESWSVSWRRVVSVTVHSGFCNLLKSLFPGETTCHPFP